MSRMLKVRNPKSKIRTRHQTVEFFGFRRQMTFAKRSSKWTKIAGLRLGFYAHPVEQFAALEIAGGKSVEPESVTNSGAGHRIIELLQTTHDAAEQIDLGTKIDLGLGDLKLVGIDPNGAGNTIQKPIDNAMHWWRGVLRFETNAVSLAPVDLLFVNQREIKSGDQFWCKEILAIAEGLGRLGLPEDLPGILVVLGLLFDVGLGGRAAIDRKQLEVRGAFLK